jgi:calcium binding protein 39
MSGSLIHHLSFGDLQSTVQRILINNRDRLLRFLPKFLEDRTDDDQFTDEKSFLVRQIELLPKEPVDRGRPTQSQSGANTAAVA